MALKRHHTIAFVFICLIAANLLACGRKVPTETVVPPSQTPAIPTVTPTIPQPTSTPLPLAARVNGEGITLAEFQEELARYQSSLPGGTNLGPEDHQYVLNDLIDQVLLAQGAAQSDFSMDPTQLQARVDQLAAQAGGPEALSSWISAHGYSEQTFEQSLSRSIAAAWMRDKIGAGVPQVIEQVHARQILLYNEDQAKQVLAQVQAGADFAGLAAQYDPVMAGDLGWFPRGYLTEPALEEAAFSLQPGQVSAVIHTRLGYHILQVIERDPQRPLDPEARLQLQSRALQEWIKARRSQSAVEILIP